MGTRLHHRHVGEATDVVLRHVGRGDIPVNAAGGNVSRARSDDRSVFEIPQDARDGVVRLNLHGTVIPSLAFGEIMARQRSDASSTSRR